MNYDKEIAVKQLETRLLNQQAALSECEGQIFIHKKEIERFEETIISLQNEIEKTKIMISEKGGE